MKHLLIAFLSTLLVSGCGGLSIVPISVEDAAKLHGDNQRLKGYVIYQSKIFVNIGPKENAPCGIVSVNHLPDYSKPYLISIDKGFGSSDVTIEIKDGWMLSQATSNADNSAVFSELWKTFSEKSNGLATSAVTAGAATECATGIYQFEGAAGKSNFVRVQGLTTTANGVTQ